MRLGVLHVGGFLDRYVARLFALSYMAAFFLVVGLFLIMDMALNLDEYMLPEDESSAPSSLIVMSYYGHQLPFLYLSMSPYVTLLAGMFTAARMTRNNELVAALGAGVSARRLLAPIFVGAAFLAVGMFALREWATEELGVRRDALLDQLTERRPAPIYEDFWVRNLERQSIRIHEYHEADPEEGAPEIRGLVCRLMAKEPKVTLVAESARPLDDGRWRVEGGQRSEWDGEAYRSTPFDVLDEVRFTEYDVRLAWKGRESPMDLSFSEARALLERDPTNVQYRTLFHYYMTFPLAGLVLLAVGLPSILGQERGRGAERVAKGFLLCVVYFGLDFVVRTLGLQGQLGPVHAGWLPVLVFGALGAVNLGTVRS